MKTSEKILILIAILALGAVIGYKIYLDKNMNYDYIPVENNNNVEQEEIVRGVTYEKALNTLFDYLYKDNVYTYETSSFISNEDFYGYELSIESEVPIKSKLEYIGYTTDDKYYIFDLCEYSEVENSKTIKNRYAVNKINQKIIQQKVDENTDVINEEFPTDIINKNIENFIEVPLHAGCGAIPSNLGTFYVFYKDGTFIRVTSLMDGTTRDRKYTGTYEIKNEDTLVLNYTEKETIIDGEEVEEAIYGKKIEGGTIQEQEYIETEELKYKLYNSKDEYGYRRILIGEIEYYTSEAYGSAEEWINDYEEWKESFFE